MTKMNSSFWIRTLKLREHPEGGFFCETYRSRKMLHSRQVGVGTGGKRALTTLIYYLLDGDQFSAFHRLKSDEIWHFYAGSSLTLFVLDKRGRLSRIKLGANPAKGEVFQTVIAAGKWFAAKSWDQTSYTLAGCSLSPGFDFKDFELGRREDLIFKFPKHKKIIKQLTRS